MQLFRQSGRVLAALLFTAVALAGGAEHATPRLPALGLNAGLLGVPTPTSHVVPARSVPNQNFSFPAYLEARLAPTPRLPVSESARTEWLLGSGVVVRVHSVAALLATGPTGYGPDIRRQVETLRAINAGRLDTASLVPPGGPVAGAPTLPYLYKPFQFQWTAGALRRLSLPGGVRGLRYLVVRAGDTGLFPADATEYTFQGLSADGRWYLTLTAPYRPAGVPSQAELKRSSPDWQSITDDSYFRAAALKYHQQLDANDAAPTVLLLDQLVQSLRLR